MRVTVTHDKGLEGAKKLVEESSTQMIGAAASGGPVQITDVIRTWNGSNMDFSFKGRMGMFSAPIKGKVLVSETDVVVDVELPGMLKHFMPEEKVRAQLESRVRGLLTA